MRSAKRSKWRLFTGHPEILVEGRYVFAPPGTPCFPGFHWLGSKAWTSDERDPWPELGEWEGTAPWSNGSPPTPAPFPIQIGMERCLSEGAQWPLPSPDTRTFIAGFDARCFLAPPAPPVAPRLVVDVHQREAQLTFANILDLLYASPVEAVAALEIYLGPGSTYTTVANSLNQFPGSVIAVNPDYTVVVVAGTTTPEQWALQVMYPTAGIVDFSTYSTSVVWVQAMIEIENRIIAAGADPAKPIVLVGHSYGGAALAILAANYRQWRPTRDIRLLTYGMPRPGDARLAGRLETVNQAHLVTQGDPIPSMPPRVSEILPFTVFVPGTSLNRWNSFVDPPGRIYLSAAGELQDGPAPLVLLALALSIITDAIAGTPFASFSRHSIKTYAARLALP